MRIKNNMLRYLIFGLLYFYAIANVNDALLFLGLYVAVPLSFLLSFLCKKGNVFKNTYVIIFCFFLGWIAFTWLAAENKGIATAHIQRLFGVFMMTIAVCNMATDKRNVPWIYGVYVLVFCAAVQYAYTHILSLQLDAAGGRLNDDRLNANVLANYTFYATFALFMIGEILDNRIYRKIFRIAFLLMIPLSFIIALLTASRQVMLVQIPLISFLLYFRYIKNANFRTRSVFIVLAIVCAIVFSDSISRTYDDSFLKERSEKSIVEDGRFQVLQEAVDVGLQHPVVGVGPGNFILHSSARIFSHCSYAEAFANHGVIGMLLYVYLVIYFINRQIKYYNKTKKTLYLMFTVFGVIFAFYNFLYVFYSDVWLMSFFMFVATNSRISWNSDRTLQISKY